MIEFATWLPQILGYCKLICSEASLGRAWINGDLSETSVTDFDELYEQIFGDLDADCFAKDLQKYLAGDLTLSIAVGRFLEQLKVVDEARSKKPSLKDVVTLFDSPEWSELRRTANTAIAARGPEFG